MLIWKNSELEQDGLVQIKKHPEYPLFLLNYTAKAQFKQRWCKELILAHGLVVREDGEIIARDLPKCFNHYEIKGFEFNNTQASFDYLKSYKWYDKIRINVFSV